MPIPIPQPNEDPEDFIDRCTADPTMAEDFPRIRERLAVCFGQLEDSDEGGDE